MTATAGTAFLAPSLSSNARAPRSLPDSILVTMRHHTGLLLSSGQRQCCLAQLPERMQSQQRKKGSELMHGQRLEVFHEIFMVTLLTLWRSRSPQASVWSPWHASLRLLLTSVLQPRRHRSQAGLWRRPRKPPFRRLRFGGACVALCPQHPQLCQHVAARIRGRKDANLNSSLCGSPLHTRERIKFLPVAHSLGRGASSYKSCSV